MKIVIPMSGAGARFKAAGYTDPKPLIKVHGRPIIEYVTDMFPGDNEFIFICREEHLRDTDMRAVLNKLKPQGEIISVPAAKKGPVWAVAQAFDRIADDEEVVVNYCDFYQRWDFAHFAGEMRLHNADGGIPSYIGFHPHLLHEKNFYASTLTDKDGFMLEIKEKHSYTADKTLSPQSGGTYYFSKGKYVKKFFQQMIDEDINLNGEYYVSLVYNLMQQAGLKTKVYTNISHFCQWGTPEDLAEYLYWSEIFGRLSPR